MARKITTRRTDEPSPFLSFLLSLAATGLGEMYCGHPARGITLLLGRVIFLTALPVYAATHPGRGTLPLFMAAGAATLFFTLLSPLQALVMALAGGKREIRPWNRSGIYVLYGLISTVVTAGAMVAVLLALPPVPSPGEFAPALRRGDILLVVPGRIPRPGDMVMVTLEPRCVSRVVAVEGETVEYDGITLRVAGGVPPQGIFTPDEFRSLGLSTGADVLSETLGGIRYAIVPPPEKAQRKAISTFIPGPGQVAILDDAREPGGTVRIIAQSDLAGRVDGIIRSPSRGRWFLRTSLP